MSHPQATADPPPDPGSVPAILAETVIALAHGDRVLNLTRGYPGLQGPFSLTTQQGVLVGFGSTEDYPLGMAEIGMLNASLTVSVNGTDLPINGDAYVQFTFPANNPAILQTLEHTRNRQNNSRDGASEALHTLHTSGNGSTATDADGNNTVQVGQETQPTILHTPPHIDTVENVCATDGELMEGEIGAYSSLTAIINNLKPQKAPAAHFRTTDALGTHSPSQFRHLQPSRLDNESTVYETDAKLIPGHVETRPEPAGAAFFKNCDPVVSLTCYRPPQPSRFDDEPQRMKPTQ